MLLNIPVYKHDSHDILVDLFALKNGRIYSISDGVPEYIRNIYENKNEHTKGDH